MGPRILIVEARYYVELSDALLDGAMRALGPAEARVERLNVPGAFEIPGAIALARNAFDGFVALGCIIRGETYHFDIVANESARGLMELAIRDKVALGNGILTVEDEAQAWARARAEERDHGGAAARACLAMVALKARFSGGTA